MEFVEYVWILRKFFVGYYELFYVNIQKNPLIALSEFTAFSLLCLLKWELLTGSLASTVPWRFHLSL